MLRISHFADGVVPAYAISREMPAMNRSGLVGIVHAHEAVELIKELWPVLSRLERQDVLDRVVPKDYCNHGLHPDK